MATPTSYARSRTLKGDTVMNILYVYLPTDVTSQRPRMLKVNKLLFQTRLRILDPLPHELCLPAALARPSSIWYPSGACGLPRVPRHRPCACPACARPRVSRLGYPVSGLRAGGGDVEAQSDRTSRSEPTRGWTETNCRGTAD